MQPAANRQHFAMVGRWSTYKGFDIGIQAYEAFTKRYGFNNELHLWLSGAPDMQALPEGVICKSTSAFSWESLLKELPNYHAVLLPYRNGSQSGVQILAWSCGVPAIVSDIQGLIQLQPKCLPAISITHIDGWVDAMRLVVQDEELGAISGKGRHDIMSKLAPEVVSAALKSCIASSLEISL
jgi:glycosyltransferase involved in cell wall biosynthesis